MVKIKIFGKKDCAKCQTTKNKINFFLRKWEKSVKPHQVEFFDVDAVDGLLVAKD